MNRADIIKALDWHPSVCQGPQSLLVRIERVVAQAEAQEREACAMYLERGVDLGGLAGHPGWQKYTADLLAGCAAVIRARGQQ
jgi:hypothetical protein